MIRVAAVGDLHVDGSNGRAWRRGLRPCSGDADVLLLAGDLTDEGTPAQAQRLSDALADIEIPVVAVLGNHDYESNAEADVAKILRARGVHVLEGESVTLECGSTRVGVAGVKGFGGGFRAGYGAGSGSGFGEPEMKLFMGASQRAAAALREALLALAQQGAQLRIALLHYAPVATTLRGERLPIFPFLGSDLLESAIDDAGADLAVHGHAHAGSERGRTAGGTPVRNVARPVIGAPYRVYALPGARRRPIRTARDLLLAPTHGA